MNAYIVETVEFNHRFNKNHSCGLTQGPQKTMVESYHYDYRCPSSSLPLRSFRNLKSDDNLSCSSFYLLKIFKASSQRSQVLGLFAVISKSS